MSSRYPISSLGNIKKNGKPRFDVLPESGDKKDEFPTTPDGCDYCPVLHKCVKYSMRPADILKIEMILSRWDKDKAGMDLLIRFGRLVQKLRGKGRG